MGERVSRERFCNTYTTADGEAGSGGNGEVNARMNENHMYISILLDPPVSAFRFPI